MQVQKIDLSALARDRGTHSSFGPSSSAMWLNCAGSLIPNLMADDDAGYDAAYGTVAHDVTDQWRKANKKPKHLLGTTVFIERFSQWWGFFVDIDVDMLDHCQTCVDSVALEPGEHFYERRVDFSNLTPIPNQRGTADCIILQPGAASRGARVGARLIVADWKFGTGVQVFAEENTQGLLYAYGAFLEFDMDYDILEIEIRIEQPRISHSDSWVIQRERLIEFAAWVKPRAHAAWQLDAPRKPGPTQCRWCKVRDTCAANAKLQFDLVASAFDDLDKPATVEELGEFKTAASVGLFRQPADLATLTVDEMAAIYEYRGVVDAWWNALELRLRAIADDGGKVPGMKLVEGRSNRHFINERKAAEHLIAHGVPASEVRKVVTCSPAEAEGLLRKAGHRRKDIPELLVGLVRRPPGKPTLVSVRDKRPELVDITEGVFDALD